MKNGSFIRLLEFILEPVVQEEMHDADSKVVAISREKIVFRRYFISPKIKRADVHDFQ